MLTGSTSQPALSHRSAITARLVPALLILVGGALALQPELRLAVPMLAGTTAAMAILVALAAFLGERVPTPWSPLLILVVALLLRLMFLFGPPQLSDDIYRYLWDGCNVLRGVNPYAAPPSLLAPPPELKAAHTLINHPDYVTIYPPAAQLIFSAGAALGGTVYGVKAFLVLVDLGLCALLIAVLRQLKLPAWLALLYAWNPLPVLEIAGSGHVDGAGLALFMGALYLVLDDQERPARWTQRRWPPLLAGSLFAGAFLVKLFPLALAPALFLLTPPQRRLHLCAAFLITASLLVLAFMPHLSNMTSSLDAYARNWEFAGFAFNTLRGVSGSGTVARAVLATAFALTVAVVSVRLALTLRRTEDRAQRGRATLAACYRIALALLLLTPTLQPWYALCLAAFLPFHAGPAGLVLCWAVFLTYQVQISYFLRGEWIESPAVTAAVFLAAVAAGLGSLIADRTRGVSSSPPGPAR